MPAINLKEGQTAQILIPCWLGVARARGGCVTLYIGGEDRDELPETEDDVKRQVAAIQGSDTVSARRKRRVSVKRKRPEGGESGS